MNSLALNQATILFQNLNRQSKINNRDKEKDKNKNKNSSDNIPKPKNSSLIVPYYNIAVQQEFLLRYKDSNVSYIYSENIANDDLESKESKQIMKKLKNVIYLLY